ncbi:MAG TPA: hypothetical protein VGI71_23790 [Scandinavium sp.]
MLKQKLVSVKTHFESHKTAILATALAVTATVAVAQQAGLRQHNEFLKEKNLLDEFYALDEE